jgi:hypothetical protein
MSEFKPVEALETLVRFQVDFVLIGGIAGRLWGSPSITGDTDVCPERSRENLDRLARALSDLDATLRGPPDGLPFRLDGETLSRGANFTLNTAFGKLDVVGLPAGVDGYEELARSAVPLPLGTIEVRVCSLEDLIKMKQATGRPRDKAELARLEAVRVELEEQRE